MALTPDQYTDMRSYIARRVPELVKQERHRMRELGVPHIPIAEGERGALARQAKGEWMLAEYLAKGNAVGASLLHEVISDIYGVPR